MTAPDRAVGECIMRRLSGRGDMGDVLIVDRADPLIRISAELLEDISILTERGEDRWSTLNNGVLTIRADNRTVVYRICWDQWDPQTDTHLAEWPD